MARLIGAAAVIPALALTSACGGSGDDGNSPGGSSPAKLSNPVTVLQKIADCLLPAGAEVGDTDVNGNRYASCDFKDNAGTDGTDITVRTYPGDPRKLVAADKLQSDDTYKTIIGPDFVLTITGDFGSYSKNVDPVAIAAVVGGEFVPPA